MTVTSPQIVSQLPPRRRDSSHSSGAHIPNSNGLDSTSIPTSSSSDPLSTSIESLHAGSSSRDSVGTIRLSDTRSRQSPRHSPRLSVPKGPRTSVNNPNYAQAFTGSAIRPSPVLVDAEQQEDSDESPTSLTSKRTTILVSANGGAINEHIHNGAHLDVQSLSRPRPISWGSDRPLPRAPSAPAMNTVPSPPLPQPPVNIWHPPDLRSPPQSIASTSPVGSIDTLRPGTFSPPPAPSLDASVASLGTSYTSVDHTSRYDNVTAPNRYVSYVPPPPPLAPAWAYNPSPTVSSSSMQTIRQIDFHANTPSASFSSAQMTTPRAYEPESNFNSTITVKASTYIPSPTPTVRPIPRKYSMDSPGTNGTPYLPSPTPTIRPIPTEETATTSRRTSNASSFMIRGSSVPQRVVSQSQSRMLPALPGYQRRWSLSSRTDTVSPPSRAPMGYPSVSPVPEFEVNETAARIQEMDATKGIDHLHTSRAVSSECPGLKPLDLQPLRLEEPVFPVAPAHHRRFSHLRSQSEAPQEKKHRKRWTMEEIQRLATACNEWGVGNWEAMIRDPKHHFAGRTPTDLEERFRKSFPDTYKEHYPHAKTSFLDKVKSALPSFKLLKPLRKKSLPQENERDGATPRVAVLTTQERIMQVTSKALESEEFSGILDLPNQDALLALNLVQKMLESRSSDSLNAETEAAVRYPRSQLIRLVLDLSLKCQQVPSALFLQGVKRTDSESRAAGGFADIYRGVWEGHAIAIKCLRIFILSPESQKARLRQAFYRESLLWHNLQHRHVLPFFGVTADVFPHTLCMVLPWMEHGNIRQYMHRLRASGELVKRIFVDSVNKWLYEIGLGLAYLHSEEVVHGDLRGANILIDQDGCVRLADFGLAATAQLTGSDYGKVFTHGGATRWQAPELLDPERFGSWSDLPTYFSDVYAFGSVCLELYTCQSPFSGLSDPQVYAMVLNGKRPSRPPAIEGEEMSNAIWELVQWCWSDNPSARPTAEQAIEAILNATGGVMSPHLGEAESPIPMHIRQSASSEQLLVFLRLEGVQRVTMGPIAGGRSADIFIAKYHGQRVALRRFRMFIRAEGERKLYEMLYASALKWKEMQHKHVLPFIGIDLNSFERGMSMVFPWKNHGNVIGFISKLRSANMFGNSLGWLTRWIHQVAKGLAYLHSEQVVHGSLRGTNVLIDDEWGVRLADYDQAGILLQLGEDTSSRADEAHRALRWMPPEMCDGAHMTPSTDIYGFACLCLEMWTCQVPFAEVKSETRFARSLAMGLLKPIRPTVYDTALADMPDHLWNLMIRCWGHDMMQRPTAAQLLQILSLAT